MEFQVFPAIIAGLIAGIAMILTRVVLRAVGMELDMDVARIWGTMLKVHATAGRILGMVIHLMMSAVIALIYAFGFDLLNITSNFWLWGLLGGVLHWVLAGLFLALVPPMHPEIPEKRPAPGIFSKNFGTSDVVGFFAGHLVYGLLVGILYAALYGITL